MRVYVCADHHTHPPPKKYTPPHTQRKTKQINIPWHPPPPHPAVPVQSAFLSLDAHFDPDAVLTPLIVSAAAAPADAALWGEEEEGVISSTRGPHARLRRRRLRRRERAAAASAEEDAGISTTSSSSTTTTENDDDNHDDPEEQRKKAEEARDRLGLALSARLEVPSADGSGGWRVLYQGPPVRRVLDAPGLLDGHDHDHDRDAATNFSSSSSSHGRRARSPPLKLLLVGEGEAGDGLLPPSVRDTPTAFRLLAVLFDTPGMQRGFPAYRCAISSSFFFFIQTKQKVPSHPCPLCLKTISFPLPHTPAWPSPWRDHFTHLLPPQHTSLAIPIHYALPPHHHHQHTSVAITIEGPGAGALPPHLAFTLRHDRAAYVWGLALLRALLLVLTLTGGWWGLNKHVVCLFL